MRNATSREPAGGHPVELQKARQGCAELGPHVEGIREQVAAAQKHIAQELQRLEAQRDELRRTARETPPPLLPRLVERIEEQGQCVQRLEQAGRGLQELLGSLLGVGEQLQRGLEQGDDTRHEDEALHREEKRMWLRELLSMRQRLEGAESAAERPRVDQDDMTRLRAERDRLAQRVGELERDLAGREELLQAKEQTLADLRRMILLLTPAPAATPAPVPALPPERRPLPVASPPELATARPRTPLKPTEQLFGNTTMQLAHSLLETLGGDGGASHAPPTERRPTSREIRFGPLDEFAAGAPSLPPPVPTASSAPAPTAYHPATPPPVMPKAGARLSATATTPSALTPSLSSLERPGTLVISEDMFNDVIAEQNPLGPTGRK